MDRGGLGLLETLQSDGTKEIYELANSIMAEFFAQWAEDEMEMADERGEVASGELAFRI